MYGDATRSQLPPLAGRFPVAAAEAAFAASETLIELTPASPSKHVVKKGKTSVLDGDEAKTLLDSIDVSTIVGLRDRSLIALLVYTFARVSAALHMNVEDYYPQGKRWWVSRHEKGGKQHAMPCHHNLETYLHEYIDAAGLANDPKALLFQTYSRTTGQLTGNPLLQANAYAMIQRRAKAAGITTRMGNHTFRATSVTAYLKNGGTLENAALMRTMPALARRSFTTAASRE